MTSHHQHPDLPSTEPEFRAQRLGFALNSLAAELVAERQKVAQLRRELHQLKSQRPTAGPDRPDATGSQARATRPTSDAR